MPRFPHWFSPQKPSAEPPPCDDDAINGAPRVPDSDRLLKRLRANHAEGGDRPSPASKKAAPKP